MNISLHVCNNFYAVIQNNIQNIIFKINKFTLDIIKTNVISKKTFFYYLIMSLFYLILTLNLIGMIPYSFTVTSHLMFTFTVSFIIFMSFNIISLFTHYLSFFKLFIPPNSPLLIIPMLILIETISYIARVFSLSIRLFANMMSGHSLLHILMSFNFTLIIIQNLFFKYIVTLPLSITLIIILLEAAIAFLQAQVFITLISIYVNDTINLH